MLAIALTDGHSTDNAGEVATEYTSAPLSKGVTGSYCRLNLNALNTVDANDCRGHRHRWQGVVIRLTGVMFSGMATLWPGW